MIEPLEIFPWSVIFETGIEEIDIQHKRLVALLNELVSHLTYQTEIAGMNSIFNALKEYTVVHFTTEEAIWHSVFAGDDREKQHRLVHSNFVEKVINLKNPSTV